MVPAEGTLALSGLGAGDSSFSVIIPESEMRWGGSQIPEPSLSRAMYVAA